MMKIWTNDKFEGHYPVGTAAVVVADNKDNAAKYLSSALRARGLKDAKPEDMYEMPFMDGAVAVLCDGNY